MIKLKTLQHLLWLGIVGIYTSCSQPKVPIQIPINYYSVPMFDNYHGLIKFENYYSIYYGKTSNSYGQTRTYMIDKKGGNWWIREAIKKFPQNDTLYSEYDYLKYLLKYSNKDREQVFKDYDKWTFLIDKKYLKPDEVQDGEFTNDPTGEKRKNTIFYSIPEEAKYEVILYEQKAGTTGWIEMDRKLFVYGEGYDYRNWMSEFAKKKLQENNE